MDINQKPVAQKSYIIPLVTICALFFIFGFITWANGTLIPFFKLSFSLSDTKAFLVATASYIAYFFLALPSSWILRQTGFKNGIVIGLVVLALGGLIFIPAAQSHSFGLFLTGIFVQGAALALLQTAVNPYLSIIGPIESAAKRISMAGICNKFAGMIVPFIMGALFLKNADEMEQKINAVTGIEKTQLLNDILGRVNTPYIVLAVIFIVFAVVVKYIHLPEIQPEDDVVEDHDGAATRRTSIFQFPHLFLGALCIFLYVGAEVMAGDVIGVYGKALGISTDISKYFTSLTLAGMLIGYIAGIFTIPKIISQQQALKICSIMGIVFVVLAYTVKGKFYIDLNWTIAGYNIISASGDIYYSVIFIALLGLANSLMWPAIFPLGINHLGRFIKIGSAIMIMGIAGGAIWPLLYGFLKDSVGLDFQFSYFITMLPCYLYILYFSICGHKVGLRNVS